MRRGILVGVVLTILTIVIIRPIVSCAAKPHFRVDLDAISTWMPKGHVRVIDGQERSMPNNKVLVFVHGIGGHGVGTWTNKSGAYWPELVKQDEELKSWDVYAYHYNAQTFEKGLTMVEQAHWLRLALRDEQILSTDPDRPYTEVAFVCHSMGTIVVRTALLLMEPELAGDVRLILAVASPNDGAHIASIVKYFSTSPLLFPMSKDRNNQFLAFLNEAWRVHGRRIELAAAYETRATGGLGIVDSASAKYLVTKDREAVGINENHLGIAKPRNSGADIHRFLRANLVKVRAKPPGEQPYSTIKIGAKDFTESNILATILAELIRHDHPELNVNVRYDMGITSTLREGLADNMIQMYVEYSGTLLTHLFNARHARRPEEHSIKRLNAVLRSKNKPYECLFRFGFTNGFVLAMGAARAAELELGESPRISDLRDACQKAGLITIGGTVDFLRIRKDGWTGLRDFYDLPQDCFELDDHVPENKYDRLKAGEIDIVDAYATDPRLVDLVTLQDDDGFFPKYWAMPLVQTELLERNRNLEKTLMRLAGQINTDAMRELIRKAETQDAESVRENEAARSTIETIVREFLEDNNWFEPR